jgi:DNA-binding transcriptional ArsR family regulator
VPPMPVSDFMMLSKPPAVSVALEPVQNALNSLFMLTRVEELSGLDEWVTRTITGMSSERRYTNRIVFEGLYHALQTERRLPSFPAYIDYLAAQDPVVPRDRLLRDVWRCGPAQGKPSDILASVDTYINFLQTYFTGVEIDVALETETYRLLVDPERMRQVMVSHMRAMWHEVVAAEWERVKPLLEESVRAFNQLELGDLSIAEAAHLILGHELEGKWASLLTEERQVIFVPSAHVGPYVGKFSSDHIVWLLFGARLPEGVHTGSSALSRSELLVRLSALTDDTRLRMLALLSRHGELCAPDIMLHLDLTQSATSRHLRQLSATGYITERRRDGAKCYSLNRKRLDDTFRSLGRFLDSA